MEKEILYSFESGARKLNEEIKELLNNYKRSEVPGGL
jgi:hypothetical protein